MTKAKLALPRRFCTNEGENEDSDNERSRVKQPAKKKPTQLEGLSSDDNQIGSSKKGSAPMRKRVSRENEDSDKERSLLKRPAQKSRTSTESVESESVKSGKSEEVPSHGQQW